MQLVAAVWTVKLLECRVAWTAYLGLSVSAATPVLCSRFQGMPASAAQDTMNRVECVSYVTLVSMDVSSALMLQRVPFAIPVPCLSQTAPFVAVILVTIFPREAV